MPKVSIIITCFNLGKYIKEAIDSVLIQTFQDFEIIIINDGSTDDETNSILESLNHSKIRVFNINNQGLANARNYGIELAAGKYILPLDADDKIAHSYLEKAIAVLESNQNIGIVYCQAEVFDQENYKWDLPEYELSRMLVDNLIFCSAFFQRDDWKSVGGYKISMIYGWEDYEFWLSIIELKRDVYRIPECLFFYRKRIDSMASIMSREHLYYSYKEIVKNHSELYINNIEYIYEYIYLLRDLLIEKQKYQEVRDTEIHNLNLLVSSLNLTLSDLNSDLKMKNSHLEKQNFNVRNLTRLLVKAIAQKLSFNLFK